MAVRRLTANSRASAVLKPPSVKSDRFSDLCPPEILKGLSEMEIQRQETIYELIKTERQYVSDMELVIKLFLNPIRDKQLLPRNKIGSLFSNVENLLPVNQEILKSLEQRQSTSLVDKIGDIFLDKGSLFKLYAVYCSNQSMVPQMLAQYQQESEPFAAYLKECSAKPECRHMLLSDFLIEPLQRICKYPLLLRAVLKNTPQKHEDYALLQNALEKVESVVEQINDRTRQVNNVQKLSELKSQLFFEEDKEFDIVTHGRYFVKLATIKKSLGVQVGKSTDLRLLLFNDILLLCTDREAPPPDPKQKSKPAAKASDLKEYSVKRIIPLFVAGTPNVVRVESLSNTGLELSEVHEWPFRKHVFLMDSEAERDLWAADIKKFTDIYLAQYEKDKKDKQSTASSGAIARMSSQELSQILATKQASEESAFPGIRIHDESNPDDSPFPGIRVVNDPNDKTEKKDKKKDKEKKTPRASKFSKVLHRASVGISNMSTSGTNLTKFADAPLSLPERNISSASVGSVTSTSVTSLASETQSIEDLNQRVRELEEEVFNLRLELKSVQQTLRNKEDGWQDFQKEYQALKEQVVLVYRLATAEK
eukprot:TRINITY_DN8187_c0_g1_i1.p1 TRINITY_DN8187_c0_g1~~TRINITY_DN8187_c0_g1_i1.p1  ORF type:complete len:593 (-),score=95.56 TRINITY_DN8187_c0_g1_i1:18-1796(-)